MKRLENKVAVITGGTRGFGLAVAKAFVQEGAAVVVASRSQECVDQAVNLLCTLGSRASGMSCDVSELAQVQALADHAIQYFGRIDVWVNNAGLSGAYGPVVGLTPTDFEPVIRTNILGAYYGSWVAMRHFLTQRSGKLINILGRGERGPVPMQAAYAASKAWIKSFSLSLAKETADSGAGVYLLSPGMMDTDMLLDIQVVSGYEGHLKAMPAVLRLLSQPPEIPARKAVWLASNATDGKTGLLVREITMGKMIQFMLREVIRKITRQPGPTYDLHITTLADNFHDKD